MKLITTLFLMSLTMLLAKERLPSLIEVPKIIILSNDVQTYDIKYLTNQKKNEPFLFLANAKNKKLPLNLKRAYIRLSKKLNILSDFYIGVAKIAIILPHKRIGHYSLSTSKVIISYLIAKRQAFKLKTFLIDDESIETFQDTLDTIRDEGYEHIIAPLTPNGLENLSQLDTDQFTIFIPTLRDELRRNKFIFGGVNYTEQIQNIMRISGGKIGLFYDNGELGRRLSDIVVQEAENFQKEIILNESVRTRTSNLENIMKNNEELVNSNIFLNTPVVKSSMIMSQLTMYDNNISTILSTQLNYNPILLSLTQYNDRKSMIIANAITENNEYLNDLSRLLGADTVYDWINYSTLLGIDILFSDIYGTDRDFNVDIVNNNINYDTDFYVPEKGRFEKVLIE